MSGFLSTGVQVYVLLRPPAESFFLFTWTPEFLYVSFYGTNCVCCWSICPECEIIPPPEPSEQWQLCYKRSSLKKNQKHWETGMRELAKWSQCSPNHQLIRYHFPSTVRFRKEIKMAYCLSYPGGMKAFTLPLCCAEPFRLFREQMDSQLQYELSIVPPLCGRWPIFFVQELILFHLMGFSTLDSVKW